MYAQAPTQTQTKIQAHTNIYTCSSNGLIIGFDFYRICQLDVHVIVAK